MGMPSSQEAGKLVKDDGKMLNRAKYREILLEATSKLSNGSPSISGQKLSL